jgi:hypothetical protein
MQGGNMTGRLFSAVVAFLLSLALPTVAQADEQPQAACAAPAMPSGELAPWANPLALTAGADARDQPALAVGRAADLMLLPTPQVHYPLRPEKPGGSISYGGLVGITVTRPGTYRIALSSGAWIDLVRDGKAATSTAHGHGPACTGVRKMVDFPLTPGRYTLQIGANGQARMTVLVARLP